MTFIRSADHAIIIGQPHPSNLTPHGTLWNGNGNGLIGTGFYCSKTAISYSDYTSRAHKYSMNTMMAGRSECR